MVFGRERVAEVNNPWSASFPSLAGRRMVGEIDGVERMCVGGRPG